MTDLSKVPSQYLEKELQDRAFKETLRFNMYGRGQHGESLAVLCDVMDEMHDRVFAKTLKRLSDAGVIDLRVNV